MGWEWQGRKVGNGVRSLSPAVRRSPSETQRSLCLNASVGPQRRSGGTLVVGVTKARLEPIEAPAASSCRPWPRLSPQLGYQCNCRSGWVTFEQSLRAFASSDQPPALYKKREPLRTRCWHTEVVRHRLPQPQRSPILARKHPHLPPATPTGWWQWRQLRWAHCGGS
jgi:hypothetical protein